MQLLHQLAAGKLESVLTAQAALGSLASAGGKPVVDTDLMNKIAQLTQVHPTASVEYAIVL